MTALDQTFFELFDCVADLNGRGKADFFLREAISRYGLRHIAYTAINVPEPNLGPFYVICTYPQKWLERYIEKNYMVLDPVVRRSFTTITPFDWDDLPKTTPAVKNFFGESIDLDLAAEELHFLFEETTMKLGCSV